MSFASCRHPEWQLLADQLSGNRAREHEREERPVPRRRRGNAEPITADRDRRRGDCSDGGASERGHAGMRSEYAVRSERDAEWRVLRSGFRQRSAAGQHGHRQHVERGVNPGSGDDDPPRHGHARGLPCPPPAQLSRSAHDERANTRSKIDAWNCASTSSHHRAPRLSTTVLTVSSAIRVVEHRMARRLEFEQQHRRQHQRRCEDEAAHRGNDVARPLGQQEPAPVAEAGGKYQPARTEVLERDLARVLLVDRGEVIKQHAAPHPHVEQPIHR